MNDLEFMLDSDKWPHWPHLPLKKPNPSGFGFPQLGILVELEDDSYAFFVDNGVWKMRLGREELQGNPEKGGRELCERLVREGWVVD